MPDACPHERQVQEVKPSARGCEECLKIGSPWLHLRLCRTCGHVGCCDDSPNRHATAHYRAARHPVIEGYEQPGEIDRAVLALEPIIADHLAARRQRPALGGDTFQVAAQLDLLGEKRRARRPVLGALIGESDRAAAGEFVGGNK